MGLSRRRAIMMGCGALAVGLGGLAQSGCVGGPQVPVASLAPLRMVPGAIEGAGATLALASWVPDRPRAAVLALHGFGSSGPATYRRAAEAWARAGIAVHAIDQRGFGANDSLRVWPGVDTLIDDAVAVAGAVRARHPGLPLTVVGHSMGGGVTLAAAGRGMAADRLVLAAPAIAGGGEVSALYRVGGWALAGLTPDRRFTGDGLVEIWPSDNLEALREAGRDPSTIGDPSGRELWGLVRVMDRAADAAPRVAQPTLTLMGAKDQILRADAVRRVHETIPGAAGYTLYPHGWHWLFRDLQAPAVWRDVAAFALS